MKTTIKSLVFVCGFLSPALLVAEPGGKELFEEKCAMCHRDMGMGTMQLMQRYPADQAILENRESLPPEFVEAVVRNGLGIMFSISRAEVSDEQLGKITEYLDNVGKE